MLKQDGAINMAVRGIKWPGRANLVVALVALHKGEWRGKRVLDGKDVPVINAYFEDSQDAGEPKALPENADYVFMGSIPLGDGFILSESEAKSYLSTRNSSQVILPLLNGQEVNSDPAQEPTRYVICLEKFHSLEAAEAACPELVARVRTLVLPERLTQKNTGAKEKWWRYYRHNKDAYAKSSLLGGCFITAATTKYLNFSWTPSDRIFTHALFSFTTDRWDLYSVVQSTLHEVWARKYSGALETRLRYSPSDCFETFPFPEGLWQTPNSALADLGERYHEHRRALMRQLWLGLTDIYNLFHTRDLTPVQVAKVSKKSADEAEAGYQGILELRRLHRQLDQAIRDAYGWPELDLGHGFQEVETLPENDRVRYTLSPTARKEVLKRLLAENHRRAAAEALAVDAIASAKKKRGKKTASSNAQESLFGDEQIFPWDGREAFVYALIPHLVRERPGMQFEFYRDAALLASRPQRCATLLLDDALRASYSQAIRGLASLQLPDEQRIRPREIRRALQDKQITKTDAKTGATTVQSMTSLPPFPKGIEPIMPLILQAAANLDKMQRGALGRAEAEKLALTKEALAQEFEQLMAA